MGKASQASARWPNYRLLPGDSRSAGQQTGCRPAQRPRIGRSAAQAPPCESSNFASAARKIVPHFGPRTGLCLVNHRFKGSQAQSKVTTMKHVARVLLFAALAAVSFGTGLAAD